MTAALEGGEWSAARPGCTLSPGKTRYPFYRRLGGPQGRSGQAENLVPTGIRSRTVQLVVSRYIDWATRPTITYRSKVKYAISNAIMIVIRVRNLLYYILYIVLCCYIILYYISYHIYHIVSYHISYHITLHHIYCYIIHHIISYIILNYIINSILLHISNEPDARAEPTETLSLSLLN